MNFDEYMTKYFWAAYRDAEFKREMKKKKRESKAKDATILTATVEERTKGK